MQRFAEISGNKGSIALFLALVAMGLQIQYSFFAQGDYLGVRLNMADLLLPFAGLFVLFSLLQRKSVWPQWHMKYMYGALIGLCALMTGALVNGYLATGAWSGWAVFNKYTGFYILLCYFALAGWLVTNYAGRQPAEIFVRAFCGFGIFTLVASLLCVVFERYLSVDLWLGDYAWDGFMANRNAFMVAVIFIMVMLETYHHANRPLFSEWMYALFWLTMPLFALYNGSRTGWIMGGVILLAILFKNTRRFFAWIVPYMLAGLVLTWLVLSFVSVGEVKEGRQFHYFKNAIRFKSVMKQDVDYVGDKKRFIALEDALDLYEQSNPLIGAGLGAYKPFQIEKRGEFIDIIDWTSLWLLTETGIIGLVAFSLFFLAVLYALYKKGWRENSVYHRAMLFFMVLVIGMSFLHALLYTRFMWFALGLALAAPFSKRK